MGIARVRASLWSVLVSRFEIIFSILLRISCASSSTLSSQWHSMDTMSRTKFKINSFRTKNSTQHHHHESNWWIAIYCCHSLFIADRTLAINVPQGFVLHRNKRDWLRRKLCKAMCLEIFLFVCAVWEEIVFTSSPPLLLHFYLISIGRVAESYGKPSYVVNVMCCWCAKNSTTQHRQWNAKVWRFMECETRSGHRRRDETCILHA